MRIVIQRAREASVSIGGTLKSAIGEGLMILVGICDEDTDEDIDYLCRKVINMRIFDEKEYRYFDSSYLEIKSDFVSPGKGKSAVIKWKVAKTGTIRLNTSYTKFKNEDKNPSWPDGTRVTLYHNNTVLTQEEFAPDTKQEISKRMDVESLKVNKDRVFRF